MNVLFTLHSPIYGGPHNQAVRLQGALQQLGWATHVVLPLEAGNAAERMRTAGLKVTTMPLARMRATPSVRIQAEVLRRLPRDIRDLRRVIRDNGIDLVLVPGLANPQAAIAANLENVPVVWQMIDTRLSRVPRAALSLMVGALSDAVMSTGLRVAASHPGISIRGQEVVPFYPPVDPSLFKPDALVRRQARAELGVLGDRPVIGMLGNINPMKGHFLFLRLASALRRSRPDAIFVWLGATYPNHAGYFRELQAIACREGFAIGQDLVIVDPGDRVHELAQVFDICWLTSDRLSEGIPTALIESMSLGIPVVATDVGSVSELVTPDTGFVIGHKNASDFVPITCKLLAQPSLIKAVGKRARERAASTCGIAAAAAAHVAAFRSAFLHKYGSLPATYPAASDR